MQRRNFIRTTALSAVAISTTGFIRFDGTAYVGDCATTTDILGPFYRPGSPLRNNLVIAGETGTPISLSGTILHKDCVKPFPGAKVELWHCDSKGVYDNSTADFRYRGTTHTDEKGNYAFDTILPVPYDAGAGLIRPAHFHMLITAEGYQPYITQLYFSGDNHIAGDPWASAAAAKSRVLKVKDAANGSKRVNYNVSLAEKLAAEPAVLDQLIGVYTNEKDNAKKVELFKKDNLLWVKNEVFGEGYVYAGNNSFVYPSNPPGTYDKLNFEILAGGGVKLTQLSALQGGKETTIISMKEK